MKYSAIEFSDNSIENRPPAMSGHQTRAAAFDEAEIYEGFNFGYIYVRTRQRGVAVEVDAFFDTQSHQQIFRRLFLRSQQSVVEN